MAEVRFIRWMLLSLMVLFSVVIACRNDTDHSPNVVLIYADDFGYADLGSFGSADVKTPHLDRLASEGVRLTKFYVSSPVCCP